MRLRVRARSLGESLTRSREKPKRRTSSVCIAAPVMKMICDRVSLVWRIRYWHVSVEVEAGQVTVFWMRKPPTVVR